MIVRTSTSSPSIWMTRLLFCIKIWLMSNIEDDDDFDKVFDEDVRAFTLMAIPLTFWIKIMFSKTIIWR